MAEGGSRAHRLRLGNGQRHPTAVVDEDTFNSVDFATKTGFAVTLNCAVVGPGKFLSVIEFISNRTHKRLAKWTPTAGLVVD